MSAFANEASGFITTDVDCVGEQAVRLHLYTPFLWIRTKSWWGLPEYFSIWKDPLSKVCSIVGSNPHFTFSPPCFLSENKFFWCIASRCQVASILGSTHCLSCLPGVIILEAEILDRLLASSLSTLTHRTQFIFTIPYRPTLPTVLAHPFRRELNTVMSSMVVLLTERHCFSMLMRRFQPVKIVLRCMRSISPDELPEHLSIIQSYPHLAYSF